MKEGRRRRRQKRALICVVGPMVVVQPIYIYLCYEGRKTNGYVTVY